MRLLMDAIMNNDYRAVQSVIDLDYNINEQFNSDLTYLHWAIYYNCSSLIILLLLKRGADHNIRDIHGRTALDFGLVLKWGE